MIVESQVFRCRICGSSKYIQCYNHFECYGCSAMFRVVNLFSMKRQLKIQYLPEYNLEEWGELNYAKIYDSGVDLRACINEPIEIWPYMDSPGNEYKAVFSAGIKVEPSHKDMDIKIYPRSGLGFNYDLRLSNSTGIVDNQYRGEIKISLINMGSEPYIIYPGDRVVQMVIEKRLDVEMVKVDQLDDTERGEGGFGSTGNK